MNSYSALGLHHEKPWDTSKTPMQPRQTTPILIEGDNLLLDTILCVHTNYIDDLPAVCQGFYRVVNDEESFITAASLSRAAMRMMIALWHHIRKECGHSEEVLVSKLRDLHKRQTSGNESSQKQPHIGNCFVSFMDQAAVPPILTELHSMIKNATSKFYKRLVADLPEFDILSVDFDEHAGGPHNIAPEARILQHWLQVLEGATPTQISTSDKLLTMLARRIDKSAREFSRILHAARLAHTENHMGTMKRLNDITDVCRSLGQRTELAPRHVLFEGNFILELLSQVASCGVEWLDEQSSLGFLHGYHALVTAALETQTSSPTGGLVQHLASRFFMDGKAQETKLAVHLRRSLGFGIEQTPHSCKLLKRLEETVVHEHTQPSPPSQSTPTQRICWARQIEFCDQETTRPRPS